MSTIVCAISGTAPEEPVFSPKTGHVYEKRLITKHIESAGKCPVTKEDITKDDLVPVKANKVVRPRPATATSIPGMLSLLQSEWDALMSETYELKTHLDTTRKQLSHALYQHDAACRVIARLLRDRDAARAQVAQLQDQLANSRPSDGAGGDQGETGLTPDIIERMTELAKNLSKTRKKRDFPSLAPVAEVKRFTCTGSHPIHQSTAPGILAVDIHKADDSRIVTGGVDSQVILFDAQQEKTVQKLTGHTKKVATVVLHPTKNVVLSGSQDATARIWTCTDAANWRAPYSASHVVRKHQAEVTEVSLHPLGDYFLTASRDKSWGLHDLASGRCVRHVKDLATGFGSMKFHPDGMLVAGGQEDNAVAVWDVKDPTVSVAMLVGHTGEVQSLSFSENGYYLATASRDGTVKIWDLRKPLNIQTIQVTNEAVNAVRFDFSGQYLALGANSVQVHNFETKSALASTVDLTDHSAAVTAVAFGSDARTLASVSMDRTLRLYKIK